LVTRGHCDKAREDKRGSGFRRREELGHLKNTQCRSCGSAELKLVCDFGLQPLAGVFPLEPESKSAAKRYPLDLSQCGACGLLQVTYVPPAQEVFHDDYRYSSSTVPDLVRHFSEYADYLAERLPTGARVLEFGCNDGVLLEQLRSRGMECTGVDASDNMASLARAKGLDVRTGFITADLVRAEGLADRFDAVTCSNVFAHIDDVRGATAAVRAALKPSGFFFVEVHDGEALARDAQFDTIYHEHLTYFTEASLAGLARREKFEFNECKKTPMHGGGLRFASQFNPALQPKAEASPELLDGDGFRRTIERCREDLSRLQQEYGPLHGYGAAGRSQMFINMTGSAGQFGVVYDDSPFRQGRFIVGTDVMIRPFESNQGECCVILAWNYAPTISDRIRGHFKKVVSLLPEYREW
jgi:SAM-dependent methyltransferase